MNNIVVFDFEVFKYDVLFGAKFIDRSGKSTYYQTWDQDMIRAFYVEHINDLWAGHNNLTYDNAILDAIMKHEQNLYRLSKQIVANDGFRRRVKLQAATYDVMQKRFFSLKMSELSAGKNIHTTDVDFDLDRPLNENEKRLTEAYNRDDLDQTEFNLMDTLPQLQTRLDLIEEFKLSMDAINYTEAQLASIVLNCHNVAGIEHMYVKPIMYVNLEIKNQEVIDFYLNEGFRQGKNIEIELCGCLHKLGAGGIHAAMKKVHYPKVMYFDVSGYYNLVMINYDLLPRTMSDEGRQLYIQMYHEQLKLKKTNPRKRTVFKTILLSVFGAMMNEYTGLYDPQRGSLVTMTGQLFIVDLLEKLESYGKVVQSNTDGIMFVPFDWANEQKVWDIIIAWEERTGFVIKKEIKYNLWQRDVNNYCFSTKEDIHEHSGSIEEREDYVVARGEAVGNYWVPIDQSTNGRLWEMKEPKVITNGIVDFLLYGITPEETVKAFSHDLRYFQYPCKKLSYDYMIFETYDQVTGETKSERLQGINRAFALSSNTTTGMVYKIKERDGKVTKAKVACLPDSVFVYNDDIRSEKIVKQLSNLIDWQYYVNRIYERIKEFITVPTIRSFNDGQTN